MPKSAQPSSILTYICPHEFCAKGFRSAKGLRSHLTQSPQCLQTAHYEYVNNKKGTLASALSVDNSNQTGVFVPWDEESSNGLNSLSDNTDNVDEEEGTTVTPKVTSYNTGGVGNEDVATLNDTLNATEGEVHATNEAHAMNVVSFTLCQFAETQLLKIMDDANAPLYLYGQVIDWAHDALNDGYQFEPSRKKRKSQVDYIEKWMNLQHARPEQVPFTFEHDGFNIEIT